MDSRKVPTVETYHMISPQSEIHDAEPSGFGDERLQEQWRVQDENHKRTIRFFCLTSRFFSLLMSASTLGIMAFSLHSYYTTHLRTINGTHAWPQPAPVLWPTYLLFAISFVTFGGEYGIEVGLLDHRGCCVEAGPGDHILHIYLSYKEPLEVDIIYTYVWLLTTTTRATR
ncbi:hypothetical protein LPUS_06597 [Lasallia pustulata]|uniref:Uncharacterized protein n=1 Tax=Lasallia pustulata TaxID=136370 RepID=A0A1W5D1K8_9LECA|nr:hypothetical protein LPUS_06597 [Lasallia pustulata]